ncbi:hypothetical protein SFRURICE_005556 [Spodoptera frugiperda]|nr:hypothetical protein SFRURICE_005556 [Spodoptera frugiperda]
MVSVCSNTVYYHNTMLTTAQCHGLWGIAHGLKSETKSKNAGEVIEVKQPVEMSSDDEINLNSITNKSISEGSRNKRKMIEMTGRQNWFPATN